MNEFKFRDRCMAELGFTIELKSIPSIGEIQRFRDKNKKSHNLNGWIVNIDDNIFKVGSWSTGSSFCYIDNGFKLEEMSKQEKVVSRNKFREASLIAQKNREEHYIVASNKASEHLDSMKDIEDSNEHQYLINKFVTPSHGMKIKNNKIYIPIFNSYTGKLQSYQSIDVSGRKLFFKGGKKHSGCFPINDEKNFDTIILCEGFATGATIKMYHQGLEFDNKFHERPYKESKPLILCCFDAGNLIKVAKNIRAKHLDTPIEIWADNDINNVGIEKACEVRKNVSNVKVYYPKLTEQQSKDGLSDYNDLILSFMKNKRGYSK